MENMILFYLTRATVLERRLLSDDIYATFPNASATITLSESVTYVRPNTNNEIIPLWP